MSPPDSDWKDKYLHSLADLEAKEQEWRDIEFSLRKCISRLSFIGDGRDPALDKRLETLRNRVRGESDMEHLFSMIEGITTLSDALASGDEANRIIEELPQLLLPMLQSPPLPSSVKGRIKSVVRRLRKGGITQELLQESLSLIAEGLANPQSGGGQGGSGLISRLFGKAPESDQGQALAVSSSPPETEPEVPEEPVAAVTPAVAPSITPSSHQVSEQQELHTLARDILSTLVRRLDATEGWSQPLLPLLGRIDQAPTAAALLALSEELADILAPSSSRIVPADKALLQLLEMLDLSGESRDKINALQNRLHKGLDERELPDVLEEITALVGQVRRRAELERQEVERFLLQLTERLQALDTELIGVDQQGREMLEGSIRFGASVQGDMTDLREHVVAATDLDELKLSISERIALIEEKLRQHRLEEESREERLQEHIGGLKARLAEVEQETTTLKKTVREARKRAFKDALTGLNNRHAFDVRMDEEYARWKRYGHATSLIVLDIDDFKKINDTYGHKAGDKVLKVVGGLLGKQIRKADFPARYGGEEFVVLLPESDIDSAWQVAQKIREAVELKGFHSGETAVRITVSGGIAQLRGDDSLETVFNRADAALYLAKREGKNRCCTEDEVKE